MKKKINITQIQRLTTTGIILLVIFMLAIYYYRGLNHELTLLPPPKEWPEEVQDAIIRFRDSPFHRRDWDDAIQIYNFFNQRQVIDSDFDGRHCKKLDFRLSKKDVIRYFGYPDISWEDYPYAPYGRYDYIVQVEDGRMGIVFMFKNSILHHVVFGLGYDHRGLPIELHK